jgi:hypothetical protein
VTVAENDIEEQVAPGPRRRRDLVGWIATPLATLVLAPALAISMGILVAESSTAYPQMCAAAAATNGCQETVYAMVAVHARFFLVGWLLLWALPWWRGLRPYRIVAAVLVGAVLVAAPLRLVGGASLDGLFSMSHWDGLIRDPGRTSTEVSRLSTGFLIAALVLVAVPAAGALWFAVRRRRWAALLCVLATIVLMAPSYELARLSYHASDRERQLQRVPDPDPPCQVHSGSNDVCPGG